MVAKLSAKIKLSKTWWLGGGGGGDPSGGDLRHGASPTSCSMKCARAVQRTDLSRPLDQGPAAQPSAFRRYCIFGLLCRSDTSRAQTCFSLFHTEKLNSAKRLVLVAPHASIRPVSVVNVIARLSRL